MQIIHPHHLILATALAGKEIIPNILNNKFFTRVKYHTAQQYDISSFPNIALKKIVVVRSNNNIYNIYKIFY